MSVKLLNAGLSVCFIHGSEGSDKFFSNVSLEKFKSASTAALIKNIAVGIIFGSARIISAKLLNKYMLIAFLPQGAVLWTGISLFQKCFIIAKIVSSVLLAPVLEELHFRDYLLPKQIQESGRIIALFKNALLFGGIHFILGGSSFSSGLNHAIYSSIGGLFYGGAQMLTGSWISACVAHSISNLNGFFSLI